MTECSINIFVKTDTSPYSLNEIINSLIKQDIEISQQTPPAHRLNFPIMQMPELPLSKNGVLAFLRRFEK